MLGHILVGVDGSEDSRKAARFAGELAERVGARVSLLFVVEPPRSFGMWPMDGFATTGSPLSVEQASSVRRLLEDMAKGFPRAHVEKVVEVGSPAETICRLAETLSADLVVVGARGHGPVGRWLLGSVSDRVVHHASRPVTVVR